MATKRSDDDRNDDMHSSGGSEVEELTTTTNVSCLGHKNPLQTLETATTTSIITTTTTHHHNVSQDSHMVESSNIVKSSNNHSHMVESSNNHSQPPIDKYHMITMTFFLQGMGELFPWNAMLSAVDYLLKLYHAQKIMLWMTSVYSLSTLISLFVLIKYGTHIRYLFRIYIPYCLLTVLLIIVPLLYVVIGNREIEFYLILALVVLMAICTGSIQSSIYGLSSKLPHHYMNTVVSGSAFAGLFITCLRILTKLTIESGYNGDVPIHILSMSTIIYFACCACLNVVCLISFYVLTRTRFVKYYTTIDTFTHNSSHNNEINNHTNNHSISHTNNNDNNNNDMNNNNNNDMNNNNNNNRTSMDQNHTSTMTMDNIMSQETIVDATTTTISNSIYPSISHHTTSIDQLKSHHEITSIKNIITNIGKRTWIYALSLFLDFFVTLSVFPGLSSSVETIYIGTSMETWLPVWTNLTFQIYDFVGRIAYYWIDFFPIQHQTVETMTNKTKGEWNHWKSKLWNACRVEKMEIVLFLIVVLRIVFIPLFIFCLNPKIFNHDSFPLILVFLLSLSGGYLNSVLMSNAPKKFTNLHEKEITATMMTFFLLFGITVGSNTGLGIGLLVLK